jgi:hypothetical protein
MGLASAATASWAQNASTPAFQKLESLVGEWEATLEGEHTVRASYRLIANDTAIMESINDATHEDMVTIYHPDGDQLRATHFCSSDNQPRLRAQIGGNRGEILTFSFLDVTNLTQTGQRHIRKIVFRFEDDDHYTQEWTQRENDEDSVDVLHFVRKK